MIVLEIRERTRLHERNRRTLLAPDDDERLRVRIADDADPDVAGETRDSYSNLERNGEFWMLWIERWNPFGPRTAIAPRCVPR